MGKFDLSRLDGVLGVGFLGGAIACFIVYMASNLVSKPGMVDTAQLIGFYTLLAGVIVLVVGTVLLSINFLITRSKESEGTPTWHILTMYCLVGVILLVSLLIPLLSS